jgi:antitoxin component HigA of HigAB toxin-antitoxin module
MTSAATKFDFKELPTDFAGLMAKHTLCEIHDAIGHSNAMEMVDALAGYDLTPGQAAYLAALSQLVEAYEREACPAVCDKATPIETLKYLLEENHMSGSDLGRLLGSRTLGPALLSGKRRLSKAHIKILAERFKVDASLFL